MSNLSVFLHPEEVGEKEVVISKRFKDGDTIVPFRIKPLSADENAQIRRKATTTYRDRTGSEKTKFNRDRYLSLLIVEGTVEPDFKSKEICDGYDVVDPALVPSKMLLAGEFELLADEIATLSGFDEDLDETAKN